MVKMCSEGSGRAEMLSRDPDPSTQTNHLRRETLTNLLLQSDSW